MGVKTSSTALKTLKLLQLVADTDEPATVTEIADIAGFDRATCYRLLMTLVEAGYLVSDTDTKRFSVSYRVVSLARKLLQEGSEFETAREVMRLISQRTTEACHYSLLDGEQSIITLRERGKQLVLVDFSVGSRSDLYCTAGGKAMLSFQDTRFVQRYLARQRQPLTANTIIARDPLRRELIAIRAHGIAYDREEFALGMRCLAAPIFEADGSVRSAIAMSGPTERYTDEKIVQLEVVLREGARELSRRRGGPYWSV